MPEEKRKSFRATVNIKAHLVVDERRIPCHVLNISDDGALLKVEKSEQIPATFVICLTNYGPPCRKCKVVRRTDTGLGVAWTGRMTKTDCADGKCEVVCAVPFGDSPEKDDTAWL
jgi:hypothetical protein